MKCAVVGVALFALWFWRTPDGTTGARWPDAVPVFAGGVADCAYELANGTAFVSAETGGGAAAALDAARTAFAAAGWMESPVRASDMILFTRGTAVAAVLAQDAPSGAGTRLTALVHPRGL